MHAHRTGKDLSRPCAVLLECWNTSCRRIFPPHLPSLRALDLKTPADIPVSGEPPQHRLQRALYEAACAVNTLRNKQGTGHGRPWLPSVTVEEARHATQVMGVVGDLRAMTKKLADRLPSIDPAPKQTSLDSVQEERPPRAYLYAAHLPARRPLAAPCRAD